MTVITPPSADVTGGIPNKSLKSYGNLILGDCVVAAYYHIEMFKNIAKGSSFKKLLWKLGFHCPTNQDAVKDYTAYLSQRLNITPAQDTMGISVTDFLAWQVTQGNVVAWSQIDTWTIGATDRVHQAMIDYRGVILAGLLTSNAYQNYGPGTLWHTGTTPQDQPNPKLGHAVALERYTPSFDEVVTWGHRQRMTPEFFQLFDGAFVFLLESERSNPDFDQRLAEMKSWTGVQQG